ncbi:MAG: hypothetical protein AMXMBFR84_08040 [Candidatus Hydrogenedentota bacterium]
MIRLAVCLSIPLIVYFLLPPLQARAQELAHVPFPRTTSGTEYREDINQYFWNKNFAALEDIVRQIYARDGQHLPDGTSLLGVYYAVLGIDSLDDSVRDKKIAIAKEWRESFPNSATVRILLAQMHISLAWQSRGSGWASSVTLAGWQEFRDNIDSAETLLEEAEALGVRDAELHSNKITVAMAKNGSASAILSEFHKGISILPEHHDLYIAATNALLPRWGGSRDSVESFADDAVKRTSEALGEGAYYWITSLVESMETERDYRRYQLPWVRVKKAYLDLKERGFAFNYTANYMCYWSGRENDREFMRACMRDMGGIVHATVWSQATYERWKVWAEGAGEFPGMKPIHRAVLEGDLQGVKLLLDEGVDVNTRDDKMRTPLLLAVTGDKWPIVSLLLEAGADPNAQRDEGWSPFHYVLYEMIPEWSESEPKSSSPTGLLESVQSAAMNLLDTGARYQEEQMDSRLRAAKEMIERGADLTVVTEGGTTALQLLACVGDATLMKEAMEKSDADVNARNRNGSTALGIAADYSHWDVVALLLERKADPNIGTNNGWTPLCCAVDRGHGETVSLLLKHGADVNLADQTGWTPLHMAAMEGNAEMTTILLAQQGVVVDAIGESGRTPLLTAARNGHAEVARLLIDAGANATLKDMKGKSALDLATARSHTAVMELLKGKPRSN